MILQKFVQNTHKREATNALSNAKMEKKWCQKFRQGGVLPYVWKETAGDRLWHILILLGKTSTIKMIKSSSKVQFVCKKMAIW